MTIDIIMPAHSAADFIHHSVTSVLAQTSPDWRLWIASDDGIDYEKVLSDAGIRDARIHHLSMTHPNSGGCAARNFILDCLDVRFVAVLDADDRFKPQKVEVLAELIPANPIVACSLDVMDPDYRSLRTVGAGEDELLTGGRHKFRSISMDTMIAWDRLVCDPRFDPELPNMTDLDFLLKLLAVTPQVRYIGTPMHDYVKMPSSMSNSDGATERMIKAKSTIIDRLAAGAYHVDEATKSGMTRFLEISLDAERAYPMARAVKPSLLFEDSLEGFLAMPETRQQALQR